MRTDEVWSAMVDSWRLVNQSWVKWFEERSGKDGALPSDEKGTD